MNSREPLKFILPLLKTPRILGGALKGAYVKHVKVKKEYKKADGSSHIPMQQISIKITNACNLRCKTCGQWGDTGYNLNKSSHELKNIVPLERYLTLADEVKRYRPIYYIWGGEPFLYPGLLDLTAKIKHSKSLLSVVTNATMLERHAKEIVGQGWDALMFSLDGPQEVHDKIRRREGTFDKVKSGIEAIKKHKKDAKKSLPWIMALVTVSVDNAAWLDKIFEVGASLGIDCMIVYYSWFTDESIGNRHTELLQQKLNITPRAWRGYLFDHDVDTAALQESLKRIRGTKWPFPYLCIPDLPPESLSDYYAQPGNFFNYGPCISPWYVTEIMANGDVSPCRDYPDFIAGNIMKDSIMDIWHGEKLKDFRKALKECGGTFPICSRCCGLMGW